MPTSSQTNKNRPGDSPRNNYEMKNGMVVFKTANKQTNQYKMTSLTWFNYSQLLGYSTPTIPGSVPYQDTALEVLSREHGKIQAVLL